MLVKNSVKQAILIHLQHDEVLKLDQYIKEQNITTRKKFIEFIVEKFIKNIK
jgi:hypothetical protein